MYRKKIIILSQCMEIGGAERALLGLLNSFDYTRYDVDLFLARQEGELLNLIPKCVNLLPCNQAQYLAVPMKGLLAKFQLKMFYGRLKAKYFAKKRIREEHLMGENQVELTYSHKYTYSYIDPIGQDKEYDLAISFLTPHYICLHKVNAKKKVAWIHTDYSTIDIDVVAEYDMWKGYDHIVSISEKCTEAFLTKFPRLNDKVIRIDNIITREMIEKQAEVTMHKCEMKGDFIKLLSVGRFTYAKNFDNIPEICKYIVTSGINVKWYLIGYGRDEELINSKIDEYHMQNHVILLGKTENPYPYIRECDIYVQPSRYEGKAVTVREAQILQKPVVITDFPTAKAQLEDGYDGLIVPADNQGCATGIINLIKNRKLQEKLINNMRQEEYSNESEISKIYSLME